MKSKIGIVILAVACVGLVIALLATKKTADDARKKQADAILDFSNQLTTATASLDELRQVNLALTNDLATSRQETLTFSNQSVATADALASTKSSLQGAQDQIASLNSRITDLEAQNQVLDQRAAALTNTIAALNGQITATQEKLVTSETNNVFLEKELQEQLAQKAELENKFNDLNEVRSQVKKLHEELVVSRRLQWMRSGMDPASPQKGAELLMQRATATNTASANPSYYDLNVEVNSDGSVHIIPPAR